MVPIERPATKTMHDKNKCFIINISEVMSQVKVLVTDKLTNEF